MKNALWSAVHDLFREVDTLVSRGERFEGLREAPAAPSAVQQSKGEAAKGGVFKAYVETDDLFEVRAKLRSQLDVVKAALAVHLTEREAFLVLFPLVVFFDELVQNRFVSGGGGGTWPLLQTELFQVDNGGEAFYDTLDDLLRKPDTLPFVYEIFYLCLSNGFRGRYADNQAKVTEYKQKLADKIPTPTLPGGGVAASHSTSAFATSPAWRYAVVAGVLVSVYLVLQLVPGYLAT
jgi:type IV/VI secretion system ImpK/VasF family protein